MTKFQMITALMNGGALTVALTSPHYSVKRTVSFAIVNGVEREDGSNKSWIITGYAKNGDKLSECVRSID